MGDNHPNMPSVGLLLHTLADIPNLPGVACVEHRDASDACLNPGASQNLTARDPHLCEMPGTAAMLGLGDQSPTVPAQRSPPSHPGPRSTTATNQLRCTVTFSTSSVIAATRWSAMPLASRPWMRRRVGKTNPSNLWGSWV